jgi:hypothetical protein
MALTSTYSKQIPVTLVGPYSPNVPFHLGMFVTEKNKLTTNDAFLPILPIGVIEAQKPVPGYGAIYRVYGNGVAIPTFGSPFKKSSGSGNYDETDGVLNLITFMFDGVDYWYSIIQEA